MGGMFGVVSRKDCVTDLFFGVDYHSHLGTKKGGLAVYGENGFNRAIHNISNSPFQIGRASCRERVCVYLGGRRIIKKKIF